MTKTMTINDIKNAVRAAGSHWFDPDTMRFFGTKIESPVYQGDGGVYFVTSEDTFDRESREYKVRQFKDDSIETIGEPLVTAELAKEVAKQLAGGKVQVSTERYKPVSDLEHFCGDTGLSESTAKLLIKLATKHHKLCEDSCNGYPDDAAEAKIEKEILQLVSPIPVLFQGDPRGATVRLQLGGEGYCVPIERGNE